MQQKQQEGNSREESSSLAAAEDEKLQGKVADVGSAPQPSMGGKWVVGYRPGGTIEVPCH